MIPYAYAEFHNGGVEIQPTFNKVFGEEYHYQLHINTI